MTDLKKRNLIGHVLALVTVIVWGSTFISTKIIVEALTPVQLMSTRFIVAYLILFLARPKISKIVWRDEFKYLLLGIFGCSLYMLTENTALKYTLASNVSIIVACAPMLTSILAHFFLKDEKISKSAVVGFVVAFAGVILVVFNGAFILKLSPVGDLLSLGAALCWAIYSVLFKRTNSSLSGIELTRKIMLYGFITSLPLLISEGNFQNFAALKQPIYLFNTLFLSVLGSGICYVMWNEAIRRLGAVKSSNYIYINPFVTLVTAAIFLKEPISVISIGGAVLIIGGVILAGKNTKCNN